jgi:tRNA A-37 threonylcarbamoyl transferase component Bud32
VGKDGPAGIFQPDELLRLYAAGGRTEDLLRLASLPESHSLSILEALIQQRRNAETPGPLVDAAVIDACVGSEVRVDGILRQHALAGRLDEFVAALAAVPNPERLSAFAASLQRLGKPAESLRLLEAKPVKTTTDEDLLSEVLLSVGRHEEAVSMFSSRPKATWGSSNLLVFFQHCIQKEKLPEAREMLSQAKRFRPLKSDPKLYFDYAVLCEKTGATAEAADVCQEMIAQGVVYKDLIERYGRLKRLLLDGAPPAGAPAAGRAAALTTLLDEANLVGGHYELRARLGEGGMGVVFAAFDRKLSRMVAVKKMRPEIRDGARDRERFLEEARIISQLTHPHIVGIHDIVQEGGEIYLVFDHIDGKPLSAVLDERRRLTPAECRRVFTQVCPAVDFAHQRRIQHRDLKPSNIMIDRAGNSWVMDFGLARMAKETVSRQTQVDCGGTPGFMAPEQHLGQPQRASDVYALGVCLYEMLTGELPFRGPDFLAQKERMLYVSPSALVPQLGRPADELVAAALQADPAKRPAGPLALLEGLSKLVE